MQQLAQTFRLLHRRRTYQHRSTVACQLGDFFDDRIELGFLCLVDEVRLVATNHGLVGGYDHDVEVVDLLELFSFSPGGTRHA